MIYEKGNFSNPSNNRYHQLAEWMFVFSKGTPKTFNPIKDKPNVYYDPSDSKPATVGKNTQRNKDGTMTERQSRKGNTEFGMRGNVWRMKTAGQESMCKSIAHPAKMPAAMARDHIISWSNPGDVILDPFAGSGTTGVEALKLGRRFVGTEIAQDYFDLMNSQLKDLQALSNLILPVTVDKSDITDQNKDRDK
jgi:site-specific DNA-methyltransferase (adenine-specific)